MANKNLLSCVMILCRRISLAKFITLQAQTPPFQTGLSDYGLSRRSGQTAKKHVLRKACFGALA